MMGVLSRHLRPINAELKRKLWPEKFESEPTMNQRIKELMAQAVTFYLDPDSNAYEAQVSPEDLELFAELIVEECADFVQFYYKDHACEVIAHDMKTQFGVK